MIMATQEVVVVTELGPDDVLFGRGAPIVQTTGNVRFRDLVHANKGAYASTRCRQTKDSIARDIIHVIDERGGRFLKEIKSSDDARKYDVPAGVKAWMVAEYDEIVEKVKQTLRETEKSSTFTTGTGSSDKGADSVSNFKDQLSTLTDTGNPRHSSITTVGNASRQINDHFLQGPLHSVSSSLLPLFQQQLLTVQNNIRRHQIQQELALSLQQQQQQQQTVGASLGTLSRGIPNILAPHQLTPSLGSSFPGQRVIEDYYMAMQRGPTDHLGVMNNRHILSTMSANNYLTAIPSNVPSSFNTSQHVFDEILQRDAMLTALRRRRLQLEQSLRGQSPILPNTATMQHDATTANTSVVTAKVSPDELRETPTISNVRPLDETTSSLEPQPRDDPNCLLRGRSPTEDTNNRKTPVPTSESVVRSGDDNEKKRSTTTDTEDELPPSATKKIRKEE